MTYTWTGQWVSDRLGLTLETHCGQDLHDLVGVAVRSNPRRAQLMVSTVLGKHMPTTPSVVERAGSALGELVADGPTPTLILGYAETATALAHCVGRALQATVLHSTRRRVPGYDSAVSFEEEHSHATSHLVLPGDPTLLADAARIVLVDDELSTGRTVRNTIRSIAASFPCRHFVVASLIDVRSRADVDALSALGVALGARIEAVSLSSGIVVAGACHSDRVVTVMAGLSAPAPPANRCVDVRGRGTWSADINEGGRHGFAPNDDVRLEAAAIALARDLAPGLGETVLVLATEELMYAPLRIARALEDRLTGTVHFASTTRSPVKVVDAPGYPIRSALVFPAFDGPDDGPGDRFAYNVAEPGVYTDVLVVVDAESDLLYTDGGLVSQLLATDARVQVLVIPTTGLAAPLTGPTFGSYAADEVRWLLKDLSTFALEAPLEHREAAIQAGSAHYAESLPIEYVPTEMYQALFAEVLARSVDRVATAVGVVAELLILERQVTALASLARAGTPVGALINRWFSSSRALKLPHYTISIVRGRGLDRNALRYLAQHHDPSKVAFIDGWTGKGAITREFHAAIGRANLELGTAGGFVDDLAVLADTGQCVWTYGTRDDFLIPSACLNSTVSGLVSRTVLNNALLDRRDYHGAKFYPELAPHDVSGLFLDSVSARFGIVRDEVDRQVEALRDADRTPSWSGWRSVERLAQEYGIGNLHLIKPGVGETTRVLLRRVPWRILIEPGMRDELKHVELLACDRGVPLVEVENLGYSCVGLIKPSTATL
jgi:adenine/guanine phosphoribosyltransferase-like PRPP-binding protein